MYRFTLLQLILFLSLILSCKNKTKADLIIHHAQIYSADEGFSIAQAMAVSQGKILAIGTNEDILARYSSQNIQNLQGQTVVPGLIDAHCHFTGYAADKWKLELWGTKSWDEILQMLQKYAETSKQQWLYGRSWDQNDWEIKEFPNKNDLDRLFPDRPVYLKRVDGHAALANQKALDIAGITAQTSVAGGKIELKNGQPTGILLENAMLLVEKHIPEIEDEAALKYLEDLQQECLSYGLTSLHDCGISELSLQRLEQFQKNGAMQLNLFALLENNPDYYEKWLNKGRYENGKITVGGFKVYSDGALGSRGACLLHDYADQPGWKGLLLDDVNNFRKLATRIYASDMQMCTHAIGDSANHVILDIYGEVLSKKNDRRWRIEHAQILDEKDFSKFGQFSIIPSVQPTHATSDMSWAGDRIGRARLKNSYAYKKLLDQNGWIALGTDFPVEQIDPFQTFYAAVSRKHQQHMDLPAFQKDNALTRQQALKGMTVWAAKAAFQEKERGSLEPGKAADFVVLNQDLMKVSENLIPKTKAVQTWIDGKQVYKARAK